MNLFYSSEINAETIHATLPEEESAHAIRVLRMKAGDVIFITDGKGFFYEGKITNPHPKKCGVKIVRFIAPSSLPSFHLNIAIAPTKSIDRFEWFLEKASEIGCDEIVPIQCRHSERTTIKTERLNKVLIAAMKQCLKPKSPLLHELIDFKQFISSFRTFVGQKFIAHIPELSESEFPPKNPTGTALNAIYRKGENVLIAIGPEGGFSEEEIRLAEKSGFITVSLGNSRLRVETAGIMACSVIRGINS